MAVDQKINVMLLHHLFHRLLIHIHNKLVLFGVGLHAALAHGACDGLAFCERFGEKLLLPLWFAHHLAKLLVFRVIRTQAVAVHQQDWRSAKMDYRRVDQTAEAASLRQFVANQKIAIAGHEIELDALLAELRQRIEGGLQAAGVVVIANPVFDKITQNVQAFGIGRDVFAKSLKQGDDIGPLWRQMQVGYEQPGLHCRPFTRLP